MYEFYHSGFRFGYTGVGLKHILVITINLCMILMKPSIYLYIVPKPTLVEVLKIKLQGSARLRGSRGTDLEATCHQLSE